jgi:hypothetical protein
MAGKIKLVQGDTRPFIRLTLKDADGMPINAAGATVRVKFRAVGSDQNLFTVTCLQPNGGTDGVVVFGFPAGALNVDPGSYEGEVEIDFGADGTQTVYDVLKFTVRAQFN